MSHTKYRYAPRRDYANQPLPTGDTTPIINQFHQRIQARGSSIFTGVTLCGIIYGGEAVYSNGEVVGRIRSGGYGYTIGTNIGLAYLPIELAKIATKVEVEIFGERIPAEVVPNTLYDPKNERLRV